VIGLDAFDAGEEQAMRAAGIVVAVAALDDDPHRAGTFVLPNEQVGRIQVTHLAERGHRRIGFALPDDPRVEAFAQGRLSGVRRTCADLGLDRPVVQTVGLDAVDTATAAVGAWRAGSPPVTGVCAYNDEVAFAVLAGARAHHLTLPGDLAVVGVDDIPTARFAGPPLTTVAFDNEATARNLTAIVVGALSHQDPPQQADSTIVRLMARDST
jgi:DNA-binding LacI/PurR family transcriptional regulator